jgi:hypothetical protein
VNVDRPDRDIGPGGDLLDGRAVEAVLEEQVLGGVQDRRDRASLAAIRARRQRLYDRMHLLGGHSF